MMEWAAIFRALISAVIFSLIGIAAFSLCIMAIIRISPFSIRKEIEEDQNLALGVIIGSIIIGISMIISAAIHG